jgi:nucleoside-diphosphate-sugar epimerase
MHLLSAGYQVVAMKRNNSSLELFDSVKHHYLTGAKDDLKKKFGAFSVALNLETLKQNLDDSFRWVVADILDTDSLLEIMNEPFDVVFHCAALVSFKKSDENKLIENNIEGTANLVNTCLKTKQLNLVHVSSVAALSRSEDSDYIDINSEWIESPYNTTYAKSKYFSELEVWRGEEEGLTVGVINPGIIMGVGNGHTAQQQFIGIIQSGNPLVPMGSNGFIWVDDLCQKIIDIYQTQNYGNRILGVTDNLSYETFFHTIADFLGKKRPSVKIQGFVYHLLVSITWITDKLRLPFPISRDLIVSTSKKSIYS